jgi:alpha-L-arabinofuranosidase
MILLDKTEVLLAIVRSKNMKAAAAALDAMPGVEQNVTVKSAQELNAEELQRLDDALLLKIEATIAEQKKLIAVQNEVKAEYRKKEEIQFKLSSPMHQEWYIKKKLELTAVQDHEWANKVMLLEGDLASEKRRADAAERRILELNSRIEELKYNQADERMSGHVSAQPSRDLDRLYWASVTSEVNALNALIEERDLTPSELERRNEIKTLLKANGRPYRSPGRPKRLDK